MMAEESCSAGAVRLRGEHSTNGYFSGRVEVCYNFNWGTVCDDRWDNIDARVVCQQLGHPGSGARAFTSGITNARQNFSRIWLDEVQCSDDNARLTDCPAKDIGIHNCYHSEDAGVRCGMCICLDQNTQFMQALSKCTDIDECGRSDTCHVNADCRNTVGSYTCTCHSGYHGNGVICEGIWKLQLPVRALLL